MEICLYVYQLSIDIDLQSTKLEFPVNLRDISRFIDIIDYKKICRDGPSLMNFPGRYPTDFVYHMIKVIKYFSFGLIVYYLEICVWTAVLENNTLWRHIKCPIIMDENRCQSCDSLIWYFYKCKSRLSKMESQKSYVEGILHQEGVDLLK